MSYSEFKFAWTNANPPAAVVAVLDSPDDSSGHREVTMNHSVTVTNVGGRVSDVVALAFAVAVTGSAPDTPLRKLFGFERFAAVKPGESRTAFFESTTDVLGVVGRDGAKWLHPGHRLRIECGSVAGHKVAQELTLVGLTAPVLVERNEWALRGGR